MSVYIYLPLKSYNLNFLNLTSLKMHPPQILEFYVTVQYFYSSFFSWYKMYMSCNMKIWIIHTSQSICRDQCRHLEPTAGSGNGDIYPSSPSWGGLSETASHRLRCLNTWSLVCSVVWGGFGDVGLLEEACHCGRDLRCQGPKPGLMTLSCWCLRIQM